RLADLGGNDVVPVRLRVAYGLATDTTVVNFADTYILHPDSTAPELSIVAPGQGSFVPRSQQVDVVLRSFDQYGIAQVELCRNSNTAGIFDDAGACQVLANPNRYQ